MVTARSRTAFSCDPNIEAEEEGNGRTGHTFTYTRYDAVIQMVTPHTRLGLSLEERGGGGGEDENG